jgi:hypothetical protein
MSTINLKQVWLVEPIGPTRSVQAMSSPIAGNEYLIETDFYHGQISDVTIYRNKNAPDANAPPAWEWFVGVPVSNVKAYTIAGKTPQPASYSTGGEQETTPKAAGPGPAKAGTTASA